MYLAIRLKFISLNALSSTFILSPQNTALLQCFKRYECVIKKLYLASDSVRAELAESERGRNLSEEGDDVHVLDPALGVGVVLAPQSENRARVWVRILVKSSQLCRSWSSGPELRSHKVVQSC